MSAKTLIIATAMLAASSALTLPAIAAGGDGTGPNGAGPGPNANPPPAAEQTVPMRAQIMFNLLDTNHDGAVDKDEFANLTAAIFNSLDANHDGKLTQDELRADFGAMLANRGGRGGPGMGPGGRNWQDRDGRGGWGQGRMDDRPGPRAGMPGHMGFNGQGPQGFGGGRLGQQAFANLDTNGDGSISLDEFAAHVPAPGQGPGPQQ